MKTADAVALYGTKARLARALGITAEAVRRWGEIVPRGKACELQIISAGGLLVDWSCYRDKTRPK